MCGFYTCFCYIADKCVTARKRNARHQSKEIRDVPDKCCLILLLKHETILPEKNKKFYGISNVFIYWGRRILKRLQRKSLHFPLTKKYSNCTRRVSSLMWKTLDGFGRYSADTRSLHRPRAVGASSIHRVHSWTRFLGLSHHIEA